MSTEAYLMGMGPYAKEIAQHLEYPANFYEDTRQGAIVFASFFECVTRAQAACLAKALGARPFDFNTHEIGPVRLELFFKTDHDRAPWWSSRDSERLHLLTAQPGWRFFFRIEC